MEDAGRGTQLELWTLLGTTQAVVDATGRKLVRPGKALASEDAKAPARASAPKSGKGAEAEAPARVIGSNALLDGATRSRLEASEPQRAGSKQGTPDARQYGAKGKVRIAAAKHGNAFVVVRRRD